MPPSSFVPASAGRTIVAVADFEAVFRAELGWVCNTLRRLGVREADVEDVAHDVFVTFHRRLTDYDPARPVRAWLGGIAYRVASEHRRRAHVRREIADDRIEPLDPRRAPDEALAEQQTRALVLAALAGVQEERRPVLVLHDIDGLPMPAIAESLSIPLNTAYSRLRLARADFRRAVERARAAEDAS
jgi:RNA polymerase sigma-70 factor (ECF subfamily)